MHRRSTRCAAAIALATWAIVCLLAVAPSAVAADTRWRISSGGTFSNAGNWNNGLPGASDVAHFGLSTSGPFGALPPYTVSFTADATNNALVIEDDRVIFDLNGHTYNTTSVLGAHIGTVSGSSGGLTVADGTLSLALGSDLAIGADSSGFLTVSTGGRVIGNPFLFVGGSGAGTLTVHNGGELLADDTLIGQSFGATGTATSTATITGALSSLLTGQLTIGNFGPGALNITSGGRVGSTDGDIAKAVGSMGTVNVNGTNSRWDNSFDLNVGSGGDGTLNISGGGRVSSANSFIASGTGSTGIVNVSGTNSRWDTSGGLFLGGSLHVLAGGEVDSAFGRVTSGDGTATAAVSGAGSKWKVADELQVAFGRLSITGGGQVEDVNGSIGVNSAVGHFGLVEVKDANSKWTHQRDLQVGDFVGDGQLSITGGGMVENISPFANVTVGSGGFGLGTVVVDGPNSKWINAADLKVGTGSSRDNVVTITGGGFVQNADAILGDFSSTDRGMVVISDAGSRWNASSVVVGNAGQGTLKVLAGGRVEVGSTLGIGLGSGTSEVIVDGPNSELVLGGVLTVGGVGELSITGGGRVVSSTGRLASAGGPGLVVVSGAGSTWDIGDDLVGGGTLRIQPGGAVDVGDKITLGGGHQVFLEGGVLSARKIDVAGMEEPFFWTSGTLHLGSINTDLTVPNGGVLAPGNGTGTTNIDTGNLALTAGGVAEIQIGGHIKGVDYDFIDVFLGDVKLLGGNLQLALVNGFIPAPSDTFTIIDVSAGGFSGSFGNVTNGQRLTTSDGLGSFVVNYGSGSPFLGAVVLSAFQMTQIPGDYNQNGTVDAADYTLWRNNLGSSTSLPNDDTPGVGQDDYTRWKANFGQSLGSGSASLTADSNAAVPEPAPFFLALCATFLPLLARTRAT